MLDNVRNFKITTNTIIISALVVLAFIIIQTCYLSITDSVENFESSLASLSNNKKKKEKQKIINRLKFTNISGEKKTLDDLINDVSTIDLDKTNPYNMKDELVEYINSFGKGKIGKKSNNSAESLDKYKLFKEKFFEIFD